MPKFKPGDRVVNICGAFSDAGEGTIFIVDAYDESKYPNSHLEHAWIVVTCPTMRKYTRTGCFARRFALADPERGPW